MKKRIKTKHQHHEDALRHKIEEEVQTKYLKRIDYLVSANNELYHELEKCEQEKRRYASMADNIKLDDNY